MHDMKSPNSTTKKVKLELDSIDVGQILDGLQSRFEAWERTERYLNDEPVDGDIEECSSAQEARDIADHYHSIIQQIEKQTTAQQPASPRPVSAREI